MFQAMAEYQRAVSASQNERIFFDTRFISDSILLHRTSSSRLSMLSVARPSKFGSNRCLVYKTLQSSISSNYSISSFKEHAMLSKTNYDFLFSWKFCSRLFTWRTFTIKRSSTQNVRCLHPDCEIAIVDVCATPNNTSPYSPLSSLPRKVIIEDRESGLRSMKVLIALQRGLAMFIAASCIVWLTFPHTATAVVETSLTGFNPLDRLQAIFASTWPKFLLVLGVFRDQGLLLSALLGLSAFFSMAETSITTLWPWKVRELAEKEGEDGIFQLLRQDVTRFLTTILIGTTVANIAATALVTDAATTLFGEAGVTAATGVMTVVVLLLTEIAPKSVAVHNATGVARLVVRPVAWLSVVLYPVGRVVTVISTKMLKLLGFKTSGEPFVTEEEIKLMLRGAELSGAIEEEEQDMIENVLEIKDTYVREVMTPLVDVVAIDAAATLMDFRNLWVKHQYSRVPVFERRVDNIVGIAYAMDMLDYVEEVELLQRLTVGKIAHSPAYFVPDSMSVWNLLREFRIRKVHMAIVLNEYGGAVGVVTLEDVVEEIVGEIFDENDSKEEIRKKTGYVVRRADGVFDVDANTSIEDLAEALDVKVPEGPYYYETVSGFICEAFGYIPRTGESIRVTLRKSDTEDGSDQREGEPDHPEDRKEKLKSYRIEILAGNARKVGSVRFERVESSQIKEGESVARNFPRILKRGWKQQQSLIQRTPIDGERVEAKKWSKESDLPVPMPSEEDDIGGFGEKEGEDLKLKQEDATATIIEVNVKNEAAVVGTDGLTVVGSQEWQLDTMEENEAYGFETDDEVDCSTASAVGTLIEKWEQHDKHIERWRQRRRQQSAEAVAELQRWQKTDEKRQEVDRETILLQKNADQGSGDVMN